MWQNGNVAITLDNSLVLLWFVQAYSTAMSVSSVDLLFRTYSGLSYTYRDIPWYFMTHGVFCSWTNHTQSGNPQLSNCLTIYPIYSISTSYNDIFINLQNFNLLEKFPQHVPFSPFFMMRSPRGRSSRLHCLWRRTRDDLRDTLVDWLVNDGGEWWWTMVHSSD